MDFFLLNLMLILLLIDHCNSMSFFYLSINDVFDF